MALIAVHLYNAITKAQQDCIFTARIQARQLWTILSISKKNREHAGQEVDSATVQVSLTAAKASFAKKELDHINGALMVTN